MDEPTENVIADALLKVMVEWMPRNGDIYDKNKMMWGYIWQDMQKAAKAALTERAA
jgi:hypothetical protein